MRINTSASNDFLTVPELAAQWRCTIQHVYNLVKRGQLPAHRIGARVIVRREDAQSFLESNATAKAVA